MTFTAYAEKDQERRVAEAKKRLDRIRKKLAPFSKKRTYKRVSTRGAWVESSRYTGHTDTPRGNE